MSDNPVTRAELMEWLGAMHRRLGGTDAAPDAATALARAIDGYLGSAQAACLNSEPCYRDDGTHRMPDVRSAVMFCGACTCRWHLRSAGIEMVAMARRAADKAAAEASEPAVCEVCGGTGGVRAFMNGRDSTHPCPRGCTGGVG